MNHKTFKKISKVVLFSLWCSMALVSGAGSVHAADPPKPYTVLAPLPGTTIGNTNTSDLSTYLPGLFKLIIGIGAIAAFVVITIGGFEYMLKDSFSGKLGAKGMIYNALWGLALVIFAYAILYTVNPSLLKGSLNIAPPTVSENGTLVANIPNPCNGSNASSCSLELAAEQKLPAGVTLNTPCSATNCPTQVGGLNTAAQRGIAAIQKDCGCSFVISGGSEQSGHTTDSSHYSGDAIDVRSNAGISDEVFNTPNPTACQSVSKTLSNGQTIQGLYEPQGKSCGGEVGSGGDHWHITFQ